jgi:hypothetical protein
VTIVATIVVAVSAALWAVDRLCLWMESRGWIYWRRSERTGGGSLWLIEEIYQPSIQHVREEETRLGTTADVEVSGQG